MLDIKERYHLCLAILAEASCYCMKSSIRLPVDLKCRFWHQDIKILGKFWSSSQCSSYPPFSASSDLCYRIICFDAEMSISDLYFGRQRWPTEMIQSHCTPYICSIQLQACLMIVGEDESHSFLLSVPNSRSKPTHDRQDMVFFSTIFKEWV